MFDRGYAWTLDFDHFLNFEFLVDGLGEFGRSGRQHPRQWPPGRPMCVGSWDGALPRIGSASVHLHHPVHLCTAEKRHDEPLIWRPHPHVGDGVESSLQQRDPYVRPGPPERSLLGCPGIGAGPRRLRWDMWQTRPTAFGGRPAPTYVPRTAWCRSSGRPWRRGSA